ncbi:response regulator [Leisingera sp. ANG-Vp]|uniref:response regulator n=1 Tax=Leisingera sp. ANG-Vp TaxID=1577896 RepID=UPI0005806913|nr:response regulator [Leisingera sp. ANG-Vp]KIC13692.1 chemotaxis protein CheY [Leisingera sp. ANG-Vp]
MTSPQDTESTTRPLTLLLVEDDDGDAKAVQRAFKQVKIKNTIIRAVDGVEALEMLRGENGHRQIDPPYMLLVDINMPRMNGIEFVEELRKDPALKQSLIFMLTTSKIEEDKIAAYNLNVAGFIYKETAGRDFLKLVNMIDRYWKVVEVPM